MLCAECSRCRRRSALGAGISRLSDRDAEEAPPPLTLRCDLCGSKRVRVVRVESPADLVAFLAQRS